MANLHSTQNSGGRRPNIMMIHVHDLGRHLGCYGWPVQTPNLDRLAAEGAVFANHFSTACTCSPSRGSRTTGMYPIRNDLWGHANFGWGIREGIKTIPAHLDGAGYETYAFGFQHEGRRGFRHSVSCASHSALDVTPVVLEFLETRESSDQPFYADVGFSEVHRQPPVGGYRVCLGTEAPRTNFPRYVSHAEDRDGYVGQVIRFVENPIDSYGRVYSPDEVQPLPYLPDRPGIRQDLADVYTVMTNIVDPMVGRILDKLGERGLDHSTLVIFTTDHGLDMPRTKGSLYDPGIGTALLMRYPAAIEPGAVYDELLSNVDLLPTLLALAGAETPQDLDGRSFLPLIAGREYEPRRCVYAESTWHGLYFALRAIRTGRFKYIRNFFPPCAYRINSVESPAAREVLAQAFESISPLEELYDLENDPHEQSNLGPPRTMHDLMREGVPVVNSPKAHGDPAYEDVVLAFSEQLRHHMAMNNDPLLTGPAPHIAQHLVWERF